jgi:hypothetical protein
MSEDAIKTLEERLKALARESGSPLSGEAIRALAETLAGALAALRQTAEALDAINEAPAMRPVLADEPRAASAPARG